MDSTPSNLRNDHWVAGVAPSVLEGITSTILSFLPLRDVFSFTSTCKALHGVGTSQKLWRVLIDRDFFLPVQVRDYHAMYMEHHATPFKEGVGIRLACSKDSINMNTRAIFTTTLYNNNDHPVMVRNQRPLHPKQYETASMFLSAWRPEDNQVQLQRSLPTYSEAGRMISMSPEPGVAMTKALPPRSRTEFSVVGVLCDKPDCLDGEENDDNSIYISFPSHHIKVATKNTREFLMRTKVCFDDTELLSNVIKVHIGGTPTACAPCI